MAQNLSNRSRLLEKYVPVVRQDGLNTNKNVNIGINGNTSTLWVGGAASLHGAVTLDSTLAVTGNATITGTLTQTGALTPTGGVAAAGGFSASTVFHSGGIGVVATTGLNQKQIVTTETYYSEVFIPVNTTLTGISVLNGHTTNAGVSLFVGLANSSGTIVANSNTTTAQTTADTYQQIPFTTTYAAKGPAKYYIAVQGSTTTGFLATFGAAATQNFGANKVTSETYGTFLTTASYATTTYTANLGPVADVY